MEPYIDKEIEEVLQRAGKAALPNRVRFEAMLQHSQSKKTADSQLSPLLMTLFMNTNSKIMATLAVIVLVGGGSLYLAKPSTPSPVVENKDIEKAQQEEVKSVDETTPSQSGEVSTQPKKADDSTPSVVESKPQTETPSAALVQAAIDDVFASTDSDLAAQSSAMSDFDASTNQTVTSVDTVNSSKQPYDENSI